ncbi:MAG: ABC transporter ATP-binding protein [Phycisphaerae bacterium]
MSNVILAAENLTRTYTMGTARLDVLKSCTLSINRGEFVAIMGKSGSGKSTLLHLLGALDLPQTGSISIDGRQVIGAQSPRERFCARIDPIVRFLQVASLRFVMFFGAPIVALYVICTLLLLLLADVWGAAQSVLDWWPRIFNTVGFTAIATAAMMVLWLVLQVGRLVLVDILERRRIRLRRESFGFVFQFYHLLPELNVLENVLLPRMIQSSMLSWGATRGKSRDEALAVLKRVGLAERLKHRPSELSGGERQRVAIARALIHKPAILFADEPTGNLDSESGKVILNLLRDLHAQGQTIVMVTHDPSVAAAADRTLRLENGRLVN